MGGEGALGAKVERLHPPSPLPLEWLGDITPTLSGRWLVKRLIPAGGLTLVYGHPGSGKSFLAMDLALHVATGADWHDRKVVPGLVVYLAAEGQGGLRLRVDAYRRERSVADAPFALIPTQVDLLDPKADLQKLIATLRIAISARGGELALLVIDTLSRTFGGGDEAGADMAAYVANIGRIQAELGCTVVLVHHRPKNSENDTPRGHGSLWGACDAIVLVEAEPNGTVKRARVTKQKDADPGEPVTFTLRSVDLGHDEDGEPVTSCVVEPVMATFTGTDNRVKLSPGQAIALEQLRVSCSVEGVPVPIEVPESIINRSRVDRVVRLDAWQRRTGDALSDPDKSPDTLSRTFRRYRERLQELGLVGVWKDWAWYN